jgi:hypothetical protein
MFQSNMLPLSSGLNVKMESACTSKIVVPIYQTIWYHIPQTIIFNSIFFADAEINACYILQYISHTLMSPRIDTVLK